MSEIAAGVPHGASRRRSFIAFVLFLIGGTLAVLAPSTPALAYSKPATDWSFYISTSDLNSAYNLGCNQGNFDRTNGNINSEVLLDFGGQNSSNTGTIRISDGATMTYDTIAQIAESFAHGYWICTGSDATSTLFLELGTNNSAYQVNGTGGASWAGVVNGARSYVNYYYGQVIVQGGNDIEPSWNTYSNTLNWASGFGNNTSSLYLNYGSADACPQTSHTNGDCGNTGWNQYDVWFISYGYAPATTAPEIYYTPNAAQWGQISQYGAAYQGEAAYYIAPWDEYTLDTSTLTSQGAYDALTNAMGGALSPYSMEIHWQ